MQSGRCIRVVALRSGRSDRINFERSAPGGVQAAAFFKAGKGYPFERGRTYINSSQTARLNLHPGRAMLQQKLDYVHMNPVRRGYVDDPTHWRYSSARSYAGQEGLVPVTRVD